MQIFLFLISPIFSSEVEDFCEIIGKVSELGVNTEDLGQHAAALLDFENDLESIKEQVDRITLPKSQRKVLYFSEIRPSKLRKDYSGTRPLFKQN